MSVVMKSRSTSYLCGYTAILGVALAQSDSGPYAPAYVQCPDNLNVRAADGLSNSENNWRATRGRNVINSLGKYLRTANITGLDVEDYIGKLQSETAPVVGLSVSGGGTQSGIGGLGVWQAFDDRYQPAVDAGTGGLAQILYYITGLSGGGAVTVALLAANNFSSTADIRRSTDFSVDYVQGPANGNSSNWIGEKFEITGEKAEQGFPVSVVDAFGLLWGDWLPKRSYYSNYSDIAKDGTAFAAGNAPMPIMLLSEVIPGVSPEIGGILYPGRNATNGFNLTLYEVNPYEFGSWLGGRIQAFFPTEYLGTAMSNNQVVNNSQCVKGFDKLTFVQGSTTDAFNAWFIDTFYDIPIFAKRSIEERQQASGDIPIPPDQEQNPLVQLVNITGSSFNQSFNDSLWATVPNPFADYNDAMSNEYELLLVDGSLTGETNPIRPLIVPERGVDLIIVYEASSDSPYSWINGTNLINSYQSAVEGNIPFPEIPDVNTLVNLNLTRLPTLFGCNASGDVPLLLYLPNSPWSGYSNFSYQKSAFTDAQLDDTLENAFNLATYGNGTIDAEWPACLACAAIYASLQRVNVSIPDQCTQCFNRHCWNGTTSDADVSESFYNYRPILDNSLTYEAWNQTWFSQGDAGSEGSGNSGPSAGGGNGGSATSIADASAQTSILTLVFVMVTVLFLLL